MKLNIFLLEVQENLQVYQKFTNILIDFNVLYKKGTVYVHIYKYIVFINIYILVYMNCVQEGELDLSELNKNDKKQK